MTSDKNFKRSVRERMRKTGESYSVARMHLLESASDPWAALAKRLDAELGVHLASDGRAALARGLQRARELGQPFLAGEHVLWGLLPRPEDDEDWLASTLGQPLTATQLEAAVGEVLVEGPILVASPFLAPRLHRLVGQLQEEAVRRPGHLGRRRLLLGLLMAGTVAEGALTHLGVDVNRVRGRLQRGVEWARQRYDLEVRLDDAASNLLASARKEASGLGHAYLGTEHILLAFSRAPAPGLDWPADPAEVTTQIQRIVQDAGMAASTQLPYTPRAFSVLKRAAEARGAELVRPRDLVRAVCLEFEGVAYQVLLNLKLDPAVLAGSCS